MDSWTEIIAFAAKSTEGLASLIAVMAVIFAVIGAFRSGVLKRVRLGSLEIQGSDAEVRDVEALIAAATSPPGESVPFETEQLARYYAQVLAQSKVSFWFSLVFASLGFFIIVTAAFLYSDAQSGTTIARFVAGGIVDAVAALFFVQSRSAQESMAGFFDKLRRDRQHVEARALCDSVADTHAQDALRVRLALHYAEVDQAEGTANSIMAACLQSSAPSGKKPAA